MDKCFVFVLRFWDMWGYLVFICGGIIMVNNGMWFLVFLVSVFLIDFCMILWLFIIIKRELLSFFEFFIYLKNSMKLWLVNWMMLLNLCVSLFNYFNENLCLFL